MTGNRRIFRLLPLLCAALALGACTSTQVKDGSAWAAGQMITIALDAALGEPKYSPDKVYEPDEPVARDLVWEWRQEVREDAYRAEIEDRERRAESRVFQAEFDAFMHELETAERASEDSPISVVVAQ